MDNDVWTPLHMACKWNREPFALLLVSHGADLAAENSVSEFPCVQAHSVWLIALRCSVLNLNPVHLSDHVRTE